MKKFLCFLFVFLLLCSACAKRTPTESTVPTKITQPASQPTAPTEVPGTGPTGYMQVDHPATGEPVLVLREYARIFELNADMVGWLEIPGTRLSYPVMQTPDSPNYYLNRNFQKEDHRAGSIYAFEQANIAESDNVTLFGHNMANGSMFAGLHNYSSKAFYDTNAYIQFDSLYVKRTYQIFAVFEINVSRDPFHYHAFTDGDAAAFDRFVENCRKRSLYDTDVEVSYGDKLLTLSTCDNNFSTNTGRFVVVAKQIL